MTSKNNAIVFDLDDTLYPEIDYLKSAYQFISEKIAPIDKTLYSLMIEKYFKNENVFDYVEKTYNVDKSQLLNWYRTHFPHLKLYPHVECFLKNFRDDFKFAIITDGRSITQRNKIKSLGLDLYIDTIIISEEIGSEKPSLANFDKVKQLLNCESYCYIADNTKKDFITPNMMGWLTICLNDQGNNIHKQDFSLPNEFLPDIRVSSWQEVENIFSKKIKLIRGK